MIHIQFYMERLEKTIKFKLLKKNLKNNKKSILILVNMNLTMSLV